MHGDTSQKMWVYRNTAMAGWVVDSSVSDKVIAIKGGSQAYKVSGGTTAGTWTQPSHTLTPSEIPAHSHPTKINTNTPNSSNPSADYLANATFYRAASNDTNPNMVANNTRGGAHHHGNAYRPAAAVGTLQYLAL
jgi:hypothetical protein